MRVHPFYCRLKRFLFGRDLEFDRAVHRLYADPGQVCTNQVADRLFQRLYWALRALQYKLFYKDEELDVDEVTERWEVGVQPPSLDELARTTRFNRRWIKYMYAKFKNECPSGRMREHEFRHVLSAIISPERATDQYIARLFLAFSSDDKKTITFQNLIECLSLIQPQTAESNARWTIRIITGCQTDRFAFPEFLTFTQAVFGLNEGKPGEFSEDSNGNRDKNKESVEHRATTIFNELDSNGDGFVTLDDMTRFFQSFEISSQTAPMRRPNNLPV
ncbi:unnamed protein product [Cylicocyclus nassatus]|uniref:EF-hand domain-containing protein n=1 Tax=Cylicocyclus nassatus TaxID=53992 RepID=A0AA36DN96_CYLNA|nr:unnamed protein product [Cylicocyclus nassatus]